MSKQRGEVFIPTNANLEIAEKETAYFLANYFNCRVEFLENINDYKRKSLDVVIKGVIWEIKSPRGKSKKHTIKDQFDRAAKQQARNLVIDARKVEIEEDVVIGQVKRELKLRQRIKLVLLITKNEVLTFTKNML